VLQRFEFELQRFAWEDNGFVFNSRNYCCLKIKLTYFVALLYPLSFASFSGRYEAISAS